MKKWFSLLLLLVIVGCSQIQEKKPVIKVGNHVVNVEKFRKELYIDFIKNRKKDFDEKTINDFVDVMVNKLLKISHAYEMGLDKDSLIVAKTEKKTKDLMYTFVLDEEVVKNVITEDVYKRHFYNNNTEIKAQQIYLPVFKDSIQTEKNRKQMDSLRVAILKGASFEGLARKFSRDIHTAGRGGNLGFVSRKDKVYDDAFYEQLYSMKKGDISPVIVTKKGIHLIKMLETRSINNLPYGIEKRKYSRELYNLYVNELNAAYGEWFAKVKEDYPKMLNEENIQYFLEVIRAKNDSVKNLKNKLNSKETIALFEKDRLLMTVGVKKYTIEDFIKIIDFGFRNLNVDAISVKKIASTLTNIGTREQVVKYGYDHGYDTNKKFREQMADNLHDYMLEAYDKQMIDQTITNEERIQQYQENWQKYNKKEIPYSGLTAYQKLEIRKDIAAEKEKALVDKQREKYPVTIYQENLKYIQENE